MLTQISKKIRNSIGVDLRQPSKAAVFAFLIIVSIGVILAAQPAYAVDISMQSMVNGILAGVSHILLGLTQALLSLSIFCLRFFIQLAGYNGYMDAPVVNLGWIMVRDVANMFFVVVLLVIAFATVLGFEKYEWTKAMGKLVLMAIFINFSKLIAGIVIDVMHVFTLTFLNAISGVAGGNFVQMFRLQEILSMSVPESGGRVQGGGSYLVEMFIASSLAFIFAAVVLLSIGAYAIVLLARMVALWVLIILSPLAYVTAVLPQTQTVAKRWWSEFMRYATVAPLLVFFLWLAFATMGAGNIENHISSGLPRSDEASQILSRGLESGVRDPDQISLNELSVFDNLASFLVPVAFLFVGLKVVSETKAFGTGAVDKAAQFGGRVATIATGVALGQGALEKAGEGLELGVQKIDRAFPLVGGRARQKYAAQIGIRKTWFDMARDNWAKKAEERSRNRGGLAHLEKFVAKGLMSGTRKDKVAEDWTDTAERLKKRHSLDLSTSKIGAGRIKLEETVRLQQQERLSDTKKAKKFAAERERLLGTDEAFANQAQMIADTEIDKQLAESRNKLEDAKMQDEKYIDMGRKPVFEAAERSRQQKAMEEIMTSALNYREITSLAESYASELASASAEKMPEASKKVVTTLISAMKRDADTGTAAYGKAAKAAGWDESLDAGDMRGHQRKLLTTLLGSKVEPGKNDKEEQKNIDAAWGKFRAMHGDNADVLLRDLDAATKKTASDGGVNVVGLLDDTIVNKKTGRITYGLQGDEARFAGTRDFLAKSQNTSTLTGIDDIVGQRIKDGEVVSSLTRSDGTPDDRAVSQLISALGGLTQSSRITDRLASSIQSLRDNDRSGMEQFMDRLREQRPQAAQALEVKVLGTGGTTSAATEKTQRPDWVSGNEYPEQT